jgi:hypothetical protein
VQLIPLLVMIRTSCGKSFHDRSVGRPPPMLIGRVQLPSGASRLSTGTHGSNAFGTGARHLALPPQTLRISP